MADCGATALVDLDAELADTVAGMGADLGAVTTRLSSAATSTGSSPTRSRASGPALARRLADDECEGSWMLYSSGTTGRPKGIEPPLPAAAARARRRRSARC